MANNQKKSSKFGLGLLVGTVIGGLAALFFTPKSGAETRALAKKWLKEELSLLKKTVGKIDREKYKQAVEKVVARVQKEVKKDAKEVAKLKKQLMKEWGKLKK